MAEAAGSYGILEVDRESGERNERDARLSELLTEPRSMHRCGGHPPPHPHCRRRHGAHRTRADRGGVVRLQGVAVANLGDDNRHTPS